MNGAPVAMSNEPVISDEQITSFVKAEIAVVAPTGKVDVTTTSGIVALVGSVPSQDTAEQVKLVAQRVSGVKQVDATALAVVNQQPM